MRISKHKFILNSVYNVIANLIPTILLQLIALPLIAKYYTVSQYGIVLTLMSIANIIIQVFGVGVNNTRIIMHSKFKNLGVSENYNRIFWTLSLVMIPLTVFILFMFNIHTDTIFLPLFIIYIILGFMNLYLTSEYNINSNFNLVMKSNIFLAIGYGIGLIIFWRTKQWINILLIGMLFTVIFELKTTNFWKMKVGKSILWKETWSKVLTISASSVIISVITYADRLFLYPILGSKEVAIYYTASLFGKLIGMGLGPISSVLLSNFSNTETISKRFFWRTNILNFVICLLFFLFSLVVSRPIMDVLYPKMSNTITNYINFANLAAILTASAGLIQPMILKFCPIKWQMWIQIVHVMIYFSFCLAGIYMGGLLGFCIANVIVAGIKIMMLCAVGNKYITNNNKII